MTAMERCRGGLALYFWSAFGGVWNVIFSGNLGADGFRGALVYAAKSPAATSLLFTASPLVLFVGELALGVPPGARRRERALPRSHAATLQSDPAGVGVEAGLGAGAKTAAGYG